MTRKRLFAITAVVAALASVLPSIPILVSYFSRRPVLINREVFDRIEIGMTWQEVEAMLGVRPGHYTTGAVREPHLQPDDWPSYFHDEFYGRWIGDDGAIAVMWDDCWGGRVEKKWFVPLERTERNSLEHLRWHFRNGWEILFGR
jgi:hypothetical protein